MLLLKINISMFRKHCTAEEAAEKFLRNLDDEIEGEEFHSDGESEGNLPLVLLSDLELESSDNSETEELISAPRNRAPHRSKRLVHDLESALSPANYNKIAEVKTQKLYTACLEKQKNYTKSVTWSNTKPSFIGRQSRHSVIIGQPGPIGDAKQALDSFKAWELFFSHEILRIIVKHTNTRIQKARESFKSTTKTLFSFTNDIDEIEMRAFIGLMYLRGLAGLNNHNTESLYHSLMGPQPFGATMSKNRLEFLYSCISFDDFSTRSQRWPNDRFAAVREVFELFCHNCSSQIIPSEYLSLDETLYPMRNQIGFRQFNPNKPAKYGMLFMSVNAVNYSNTFIAAPYCGKPSGNPTSYYVTGTENIVKYLITKLQQNVDLQGRNISFDRLYTSIPLAQWLLSHNITCVGTIKANRKGIPVEIKELANREPLTYECFWEAEENKLSLHSYVVNTKSSGKRNVLLLSTMQPILGTTKDDGKQKPAIYKLYDYTKGGTEVVDQRMASYTCKAKSKRWTLPAFSYILDVSRINAATVMSLNKGNDPRQIDSYDFGMDLALALIRPHVQRRPSIGLQFDVQRKMKLVLGEQQFRIGESSGITTLTLGQFSAKSGTRKRCRICSEIEAGPGQKKRKWDMNKSRNQCQTCGHPSCMPHCVQICIMCFEQCRDNFQCEH